MLRFTIRAVAGASLLLLNTTMVHAKDYNVTVSADRDYHDCPVHVSLNGHAPGAVTLTRDGTPVPAQVRSVAGKAEVVWIIPDLKQGETLHYRLHEGGARPGSGGSGVSVERAGGNVEVRIGDELFTRYDATTGPNKPFLYPLIGPDHKRLTRGYPLEHIEGETSHDHPHHRGLWFTHGEVNGEDYWSQEPGSAKTVNTGFEEIVSGPVFGRFVAHTDWITKAGQKAAEDRREITVYNTPDGRLLDFAITIKPVGAPLEFQDTKEGSFGLRLPDSMRVEGGDGHIVTSAGVRDRETWGTRAEWVDYYGTVQDATVGIAILDAPENLRHPTYWHVRDYGLFAANPFGIHDFVKGQPKGAGNHTVPVGGALTFRYRLYLHRGTTTDARVAQVWNGLAAPPRVTIR